MKIINNSQPNFNTLSLKLSTSSSPYSIYPFLFRGGAPLKLSGPQPGNNLDELIADRLPLIIEIHDVLKAKKIFGISDKTLTNCLYGLKSFFAWADKENRDPSIASLPDDFIDYTEHLLHRNRIERTLSDSSTYAIACSVSTVFDSVLRLRIGLLSQSRIRNKKKALPWMGLNGTLLDEEAKQMGNALLKLSIGLSLEAISGPLPLAIQIGAEKQVVLGKRRLPEAVPRTIENSKNIATVRMKRRELINFRTEVEMLIFISNTGMNLEQVRTQRFDQFNYQKSKTKSDCIEVSRGYKARRGGEVEFEIFPKYKQHFLRYLDFRNEIFPDDQEGPLFKFIDSPSKKKPRYYELRAVKKMFEAIGVPYRTPRKLRSIRINDLLDRTDDHLLVADMAQHSPEVLLRTYARIRPTDAMREVAKFQQIQEQMVEAPGPGGCAGQSPETIEGTPERAPKPDCRSPSGCLFCVRQRDIESMDHIWSLLSFQKLKSIELSRYRGPDPSKQPACLVIQRVSDKVSALCLSNASCSEWAQEAQLRMEEGWFHPAWNSLISFAERIL